MDPYYNFYETLTSEIAKFHPIKSNVEFNRNLAQPLLMLPFITEELQLKINEQLRLPKMEDDSANQVNCIQSFLLLQYLRKLYASQGKDEAAHLKKIKVDYREVEDW